MSGSKSANQTGNDQGAGLQFIPEYEERVLGFLKKVKFRKQVFGGVSEKDVWTKIGELNQYYRQALLAERARYDALLEERNSGKARDEK